jgi:hypothetical protein
MPHAFFSFRRRLIALAGGQNCQIAAAARHSPYRQDRDSENDKRDRVPEQGIRIPVG